MKYIFLNRIFSAVLLVVFSFGVVFSRAYASDTTTGLFFRSSKTASAVGTPVTLDVVARSSATPVNAFSGTIAIPAGFIVDSLSTTGSVITFWTKTPTGKTTIPFEGIVIGAPYQGVNGVLFRITGHLQKPTTAIFHFVEGSMLTADGSATNILTSLGTYSLGSIVADTSVVPPVHTVTTSPTATLPVITGEDTHTDTTGSIGVDATGAPSSLYDTSSTAEQTSQSVTIERNFLGILVQMDEVPAPDSRIIVTIPVSIIKIIVVAFLLFSLGICILIYFLWRMVHKVHLMQRMSDLHKRAMKKMGMF